MMAEPSGVTLMEGISNRGERGPFVDDLCTEEGSDDRKQVDTSRVQGLVRGT